MERGQNISQETLDQEVILVLVEGHAEVTVDGKNFGILGDRLDVFEKSPPHCVYVPSETDWLINPTTNCTIAVCSAPCSKKYEASQLGPNGIKLTARGKGTNTRYINNIAMEDRDVASSLLVTEVFTPTGHWSSYPPHRHDEDDFPNFRKSLRLSREILSQEALVPFKGDEIQPGDDVISDEGLDEFIKNNCESAYHPCGTCKIGKEDDPSSVVLNDCKVKGFQIYFLQTHQFFLRYAMAILMLHL